jgi:hypothetical protein
MEIRRGASARLPIEESNELNIKRRANKRNCLKTRFG